ncbi:uncharacterized protein LOC118420646 [Branchiostoma floridae]|uniref:Uncharacterized protein LOC118420646 n=1 Tax=Branchiostoma floridae TaxID=7739 RepID=A0A9J7LKG5_BRAFL|nr:uncharacterized protein LOC118420646 [Branchiostoma floridae]
MFSLIMVTSICLFDLAARMFGTTGKERSAQESPVVKRKVRRCDLNGPSNRVDNILPTDTDTSAASASASAANNKLEKENFRGFESDFLLSPGKAEEKEKEGTASPSPTRQNTTEPDETETNTSSSQRQENDSIALVPRRRFRIPPVMAQVSPVILYIPDTNQVTMFWDRSDHSKMLLWMMIQARREAGIW